MNISTDDLYEFGKWAKHDTDSLQAKSQWYEMIMKHNVEQITDISYTITDDKAEKIDRAVCALCRYNPILHEIFVDHYLRGFSYRKIAEKYECDKSTISNKLNEAGGFVVGFTSNC